MACRSLHRVGPVNSNFANILSLVFLVGFCTSAVISSSVGRGREFIFAFPTNLQQTSSPDETANLSLSITAFSSGPTHVNITVVGLGWSRGFTLDSQYEAKTVGLPPQAEARRSAVQNTTVFVTASQDVTVLALSTKENSNGGFLVRSTPNLGVDYFVASFTPTEGEWSEFTISATQDNTQVRIQLKAPLIFDNRPYSRGELELSLDRLQTAQFQGTLDLTGSQITSTLPISVISGSSASSVPAETGTADHLVDQLPPINTWGRVYALAPFMGQRSGYTCKVITSCPTITMIQGFGETVPLFAAGDSHEWDASVSSPAVIIADKPVLVVQFSKGSHVDVSSEIGNPSMTVIPPVGRFAAGGALLTIPRPPPGAYPHLAITTRCNETNGILLNGAPLVPNRAFGFPPTDTCVLQKKITTISLSNVIHVHSTPTVPLAVSVAVYGSSVRGAYSVSVNLGTESQVCSTDMDECCTSVSFSSADGSSSSYHSSSDYSSVDSVESMSSESSVSLPSDAIVASDNPTTHPDQRGSVILSNVESNQTTIQTQGNSSITPMGQTPSTYNTTTQEQSTSNPLMVSFMPGSNATGTLVLRSTDIATSSPRVPLTDSSSPTVINSFSSPTLSEASTAEMTSRTNRPSPRLTTDASSTRLPSDRSVVTGMASTSSSTQTTGPEDLCVVCKRPYQIVLYGGVALAILLLIILVICLVKLILKRRAAKMKLQERNSRWVAFPVGISAEELSLTRTPIKSEKTPPPVDV